MATKMRRQALGSGDAHPMTGESLYEQKRKSTTWMISCVGLALLFLLDLFALWGGLPLTTIGQLDINDILIFWAVPHILTMAVVFLLVARFSNHLKYAHIERYILLAGTVMLVGALSLVFQDATGITAPWLMTIAAVLIAAGSASLLALWEFIFVGFTDERIVRTVLIALLLSSASYLIVSLIPSTAQLYLFPVIIVTAATILVYTSRKTVKAWCAEQLEGGNAASSPIPPLPDFAVDLQHKPQLLAITRLIRDPLLCVAAIMFAIAITRTVTLSNISDANLVNIAGCIGALLGGAILYAARYVLGSALGSLRTFNLLRFYRVLFPTLTTVLLLLPIFGNQLSLLVSSLVFVGYMVSFVLILPTCMTLARQDSTHPLAVFGVFMGGINLVFAFATGFAVLLYRVNYFGAATLTVGILLALYVLAMTYNVALNAWRRREQEEKAEFGIISKSSDQIVSMKPSADIVSKSLPVARISGLRLGRKQPDSPAVIASPVLDSAQASALKIASDYQLTVREREILLLLTQGRDVPTIAKQLFISENTVRTHTKNIYIKLDIHSKQELLDRVEEYHS